MTIESTRSVSDAGVTIARLREHHVLALQRIVTLTARAFHEATAVIWDSLHQIFVHTGRSNIVPSRARHTWAMLAAVCTQTARAVLLSDRSAAFELHPGNKRCGGMFAVWLESGEQKLRAVRDDIERIAIAAEAQSELFGAVVAARIALLDVAAQAVSSAVRPGDAGRGLVLPKALPRGAVLVFDRDLRYHLAEGELLGQWAGYPQGGMIGRTMQEVVSSDNRAFLERIYRATLAGEALRFDVTAGGRAYEAQSVPVRDPSGEVTRGVLLVHDVTELRQLELRLSAQKPVEE